MAKAPKTLSKAEIKTKTAELKAARKVVLDTFAPFESDVKAAEKALAAARKEADKAIAAAQKAVDAADKKREKAVAARDKGQEVLANLMSANTEEQAKARAYIGSQLDTLQARKGRGDAGLEGEIQMFSRLSAIEEAARAAEKKGGALTEEEANRIAKSYSKTAGADFTGKDILTGAAGIQRSIEGQRGANRRAIGRMYGASSL